MNTHPDNEPEEKPFLFIGTDQFDEHKRKILPHTNGTLEIINTSLGFTEGFQFVVKVIDKDGKIVGIYPYKELIIQKESPRKITHSRTGKVIIELGENIKR